MDRDLFQGLFNVTALVIGVALIAVLVSKNSNTSGVLNAYGNAFSTLLGTAEAPVASGSSNAYNFA